MSKEKHSGGRIIAIRIVIVLVFLLYTTRLFSMQILSGDIYHSRARNIARHTSVIQAQRGEIFDRNFSQPLVYNADSFAVGIIPAEVPRQEMSELKDRLAPILGLTRNQIDRRLPPSMYNLFNPIELAVNVPFPVIAALAEQSTSFPGVFWELKPMRVYPNIGSLSHIVGYVGSITREELTVLFNLGYRQGDIIGKAGIERQYDELLRGREGRETRTVDVRGRNVGADNVRIFPETGNDIVLTIDRNIQALAEAALGRRIGAIVVLKPNTGEVLAMVSSPWYDPNIFNQLDTGAEFQALINNPNRPLLNRAIQASYPPASSFKILMSTAILSENSFNPLQTVECRGEITFGDRVWRCHNRTGHGRLNLRGALAQSCNIYYWTVGTEHLGAENIINHSFAMGFGEVTHIDLPGEISGLIPTPQWKERRLHERWVGGDTMNMSIGQGFTLVTPLQMANMVAMVVNDGVIYTPHLLKEVRDSRTGAIEMRVDPTVLHRSNVSPAVFATVREDMRGVISEGTARYPVNIRTVEIAGKTGTGEAGFLDRWHSWLVTYGPYETDDPDERIVVSVLVEAANQWEWWAPYATAIIYQGVFGNMSYEDAIRALGFQNIAPIEGRRE